MNLIETTHLSGESNEVEQRANYIKISKGVLGVYDQAPEGNLVGKIDINAQNADEVLRSELGENEDIYSPEEKDIIVETTKRVSFGTSFPENAIAFYLAKTNSAITQRSRPDWLKNPDTERNLEVDIFVDPPGVGIEYDGWRYHQDSERDVKKDQIAREHGYRIIHIREKGCPDLSEDSVCIERDNNGKNSDLSECIRKCCRLLGAPELDIDVARDKKEIMAFMQKTILDKLKSIDALIKLGYEEDDAKDITSNITLSDLNLSGKIYRNFVFLQELGYSRDEVIKMTKSLPTIYSLSIDNMKQKISDMQGLGYSRDEVIKMTKSLPAIYSYSIDNMKQKILDLQELGYSRDDVIKMTKSLPTIYSLSIDNMKQKISDMQELGYSQDDV
ncbi:hypothetical protein IKF26_01075, partial [Candidatus Saccharibacteria bacterium]|nr:hypothetical protein [Candidatus Saccharibacteria bacterium]